MKALKFLKEVPMSKFHRVCKMAQTSKSHNRYLEFVIPSRLIPSEFSLIESYGNFSQCYVVPNEYVCNKMFAYVVFKNESRTACFRYKLTETKDHKTKKWNITVDEFYK